MEEKDKENEFSPKCYKIYADFKKETGIILDHLSMLGDIIIDDNHFVVFLDNKKTKKDLIKAIRKLEVYEYYFEEIVAKQCENQDTFLHSWYCEKYDERCKEFIEKQNQSKLSAVNANLLRLISMFDSKK